MKLNKYSQSFLDQALSKSAEPPKSDVILGGPSAVPTYTPSPFEARVDDLNRSILAASVAQAQDDLNIHRLMFEPVNRRNS